MKTSKEPNYCVRVTAREPPPEAPVPDPHQRPTTIRIKLADGKERRIQHMTATTFWSVDGRPMSAAEFITRLFGELPALFKDEDELRAHGASRTPARHCWIVWPRGATAANSSARSSA